MRYRIQAVLLLLAAAPGIALAQAPVDENGVVLGAYEPAYGVKPEIEPLGNEDIPRLSNAELEDLVGPIALYPDDLLAIVLPASAYPLQLVEAARFLEALENDPALKPDPEWDDSVVALLNYPEVIELLNDDIDWTWRLGEAVVAQQGEVVAAIESFRDRAYAAGNLKSDEYQNVTRDEGTIEITPVSDDVIYVPYYEPERVIVYQPRRVYYYYPRAYPVYYYPYSSAYHFDRGYFWGVTTAFTIGWMSDSLHVYHHSYRGHPYYGRHYWDRWWYRRPSIHVYNTSYVRRPNVTINRYYHGDRWEPRHDRRDFVRGDRVTRNRHTPPNPVRREQGSRPLRREEPIRFRARDEQRQPTVVRRENRASDNATRNNRRDQVAREQRRDTTTRQRSERRTTIARNEPRDSTAREQRRQPERQVQQQRRQSERQVRQQRRQPEQQVQQQRRQTVVRDYREQRRQPERQARQERRQPERQVRTQRRQTESRPQTRRSEPQRQARSEPRESRSQSRSSNSRRESRGRSERRARR